MPNSTRLGDMAADEFTQMLKKSMKGIFDSGEDKEACPSTDLLTLVEADLADETEAQHVRAHTVHCRECSKKFLLLRGLRNREHNAEVSEVQ